MKEIWLRSQTVFRAADGKIHTRDTEDYLVNPEEDGVTAKEIKGWIYDIHCRLAASAFYRGESIPVKRTRPQKDVERYTTELRNGTLETSIVRLEKSVAESQQTLAL